MSYTESGDTMSEVEIDLQDVNWAALLNGSQYGGGEERFAGMVRQRGRGIGSVLSAIASFLPVFLNSKLGSALTSALTSTGSQIIGDIARGENVINATKTRARASVKNLTGLGRKRTKTPIAVVSAHSKKKRVQNRSLLFNNA